MRRGIGYSLVLVSILAVAVPAAGCGSSKKKTHALTKSEFLAKGNAICRKGNQQINAVGNRVFSRKHKPTKAQALKFAKDTIIPSVQSQINGVRALGAPAGDKAKVSAIVNAAQSALDKAKKNPIVLTQNGPDPFKKANQLSKAYGLTVCGSGGG